MCRDWRVPYEYFSNVVEKLTGARWSCNKLDWLSETWCVCFGDDDNELLTKPIFPLFPTEVDDTRSSNNGRVRTCILYYYVIVYHFLVACSLTATW